MQISFVVVLTGLLSLVAAQPEGAEKRQDAAQSIAAADQLLSYFSVLATNTAFVAAGSAIQTDVAAISSLSAFEESVSAVFATQGTLAANYLEAIPATVRPFFSSVYAAQASILTANGFSNPIPTLQSEVGGKATSTSKAAAARETGMGRLGSMVVAGAVGLIGMVVAL
ncbi:hypothetical protein LZ554_008023 [Drepanopeziza brunnea f. sp. 'monogermtubi']|nr:hypothetical protein LZ554_008023 [Drepanopeziza brunnea f. sp. 'monogermtubi']